MWMIAGPFIPDRFLFLFPVSPLFPTSTVRENIVEPEDTGAIGDVHVFLVFLNTYPRIMEWSG